MRELTDEISNRWRFSENNFSLICNFHNKRKLFFNLYFYLLYFFHNLIPRYITYMNHVLYCIITISRKKLHSIKVTESENLQWKLRKCWKKAWSPRVEFPFHFYLKLWHVLKIKIMYLLNVKALFNTLKFIKTHSLTHSSCKAWQRHIWNYFI